MASNRPGSLRDIPDDIGVQYVKEDVSLRKKQKATAFMAGSYIQNVELFWESPTSTAVRATIYRSQRKTETPHIFDVTIDSTEKLLSNTICSCQAGLTTSMCSHGVAVIMILEQCKIAGYKEIPALLSSTSLPQQWDKPRGEKIKAEPVSQIVVAKPGNQKRKRKPIIASYVDNRNIEVTEADILRLK